MSHSIKNKRAWLFVREWSPGHLGEPLKLLSKHERWRRVACILNVSKQARLRLDWIIYYHEGHSAAETARHYGITPKTFYKWFKEFDEDNIHSIRKLEDKSRAPHHVRQREITSLQKERVVALRIKHIRYGKVKLAKLYEQEHDEWISSWHVQKVIEDKKLYFNMKKTTKIRRKRARSQKKKRITELQLHKTPWYRKKAGFIICLDTIVIHWLGVKRYVFTAVDKYGKVAYARMYKTKGTVNAADFLGRLYWLLDGQVPRVGHDNGSEFEKLFKRACLKLGIEQYWSRVRTPKDNPENERFNRTLKEEFIALGNYHPDPAIFNPKLTEWLIEYNFHRPHESLGYKTPIEFSKVLPMYSSCTSP